SSLNDFARRDCDTVAHDTVFIHVDAKSGKVRKDRVALCDVKGSGYDILSQSGMREGQRPCNVWNDGCRMKRGGARNAAFSGLAGNIDIHSKSIAKVARLLDAAKTAQLECLQADSPRGLMSVVVFDILNCMNALIGPDGNIGGGGNPGHALEVVGRYRLLEEIKSGPVHRADIGERLLRGIALVGVRGNQHIFPEGLADFTRARGVLFGTIDAHFYLI